MRAKGGVWGGVQVKGKQEHTAVFFVHYGFRIKSKGSREEAGEGGEVEKMKNCDAVKWLRTDRTVFLKPVCSSRSSKSF